MRFADAPATSARALVKEMEPFAYSSPIAANVHESMADLFELGLEVKPSMDQFDACALLLWPSAEPDIKALSEREKASSVGLLTM